MDRSEVKCTTKYFSVVPVLVLVSSSPLSTWNDSSPCLSHRIANILGSVTSFPWRSDWCVRSVCFSRFFIASLYQLVKTQRKQSPPKRATSTATTTMTIQHANLCECQCISISIYLFEQRRNPFDIVLQGRLHNR